MTWHGNQRNPSSQHSNSQAASQSLRERTGHSATTPGLPQRVGLGRLKLFLKVKVLSLPRNSPQSDNKCNSAGMGWSCLKDFPQKSWKFSTLHILLHLLSQQNPTMGGYKGRNKMYNFWMKRFISEQAPSPGSHRRAAGLCPCEKNTKPATHAKPPGLRRAVRNLANSV